MRKSIYLGFLYGIVVLTTVFLWDYLYYGTETQVVPVLAKAKFADKEQIKRMELSLAENQKERETKAIQEKEKTVINKKKNKIKKKTIRDREVLERIVEAEAANQGMKGKILIANVILNRVKKSKDSIREVVFANENGCYQFSPVGDGRFSSVRVSDTTKKAVDRALNGTDYSKGARYFMNRSTAAAKNISWFERKLTFLFRYGAHEFFR